MSKFVIGWKVDEADRAALLAEFPAAYPTIVADHVTLSAGVEAGAAPPADATGEIVGVADDGEGVQAMVVRIGGSTDRPGGGTYHITWSLDEARGRKASHSNDVIAAHGWADLDRVRTVRLIAARFP